MASDYGVFSRTLHRLVLGAQPVAEMSFSIDQALAKKPQEVAGGRHVFVSGLARAGTTVLMRRIHDSGAFRSLTYADMPFVLAPNFWRMLRGGQVKKIESHERAHGDGLKVGADSPESLEEVFWRVFDGDSYIAPDRLLPHAPDQAMLAKYRDYVAAILASAPAGARYLAKNNNNILRLPSLARAFPEALILVPFRRPGDQAASLLAQHKRFVEMQAEDRFTRAYMGWLVHHEFGADHRPFATHPASARSAGQLAYWVEQWLGVYRWLMQTAPANAAFVCYEDLCDDPGVWTALAGRLHIPPAAETAARFTRSTRESPAQDIRDDLMAEAMALYEQLRARQYAQIDAASAAE